MPWLTLPDPKLIKVDAIKEKSSRIIIINSGESGNRNALSLLMSWGAYAYPFTKRCLGQLNLKSSLEILFHSRAINEEVNNKLIFLYAESPGQNLKMKCNLEKLVQIHGKGKFEIVYVGFSAGSKVAEGFQKKYEDVTQSMNWTKLSFSDMMTFWYRCKYLVDEEVHEPNSASTLKSVVKALVNEERWLVVLDGGMVTAHGIDVVQMVCELSDEKDDEVDVMIQEELRESLKEGHCGETLRRYFRDELNHRQHHHPLRPRWTEYAFFCDRCHFEGVYTSSGKRLYSCYGCEWDLCWNCWKEFVKEEVRREVTHES